MMVVCCAWSISIKAATLPPTLYEEWRKSPFPADGSVAAINPTSLQWPSVGHWENRSVEYRVELSDDLSFPKDRTFCSNVQRWCFFNPHKKLNIGKWYWRYEIRSGDNVTIKGPYSFEIKADTPVFESPMFDEFLANVPKSHPRVITQGRSIADIRKSAVLNPLHAGIVSRGKKVSNTAIYNGPVSDSDLAKGRALSRTASKELQLFNELLEAYVLSGEQVLLNALSKRIEVILGWPTDDLLGSQVLVALSSAYDALYQELTPEVKAKMLAVIDKQLRKGLSTWPGIIEGRQVENHFWQMELSGNFTAALSTIPDLKASRGMLEYTYELFLARFPNLAMGDGGWAEGLGYFGVNKSTVVDMALILKKVGGVDVFKMPWYQSLADYFIYFAPINGRIDGFGDMHDRVGNGNIGQAMMFVVGQENNDAKALFRAASLAKMKFSADEPWDHDANVEPWYQIVNNIKFDQARVLCPADLPQARMFRSVGLAAMHNDVLDSSRDTAVYFRASPFGAKGHMHANQNTFNVSRKGEPLFYSTGYYTTFADPHSMSSYRHTRAYNSILVNGCGQAFGHEGYGWIKRYANGEKMSYVCGDATMAYRQTVDRQFLAMLAESKIAPTLENGHGDSKLKLFERHMLFVRPDILIVYDVLESEKPSDWTLLLHTMKKPALTQDGRVFLDTGKNSATAYVISSQPLVSSMTDQFFSPPVDIKKKYGAMPNQYHIRYQSTEKSCSMRFLSVLQFSDSGKKCPLVVADEKGILVGDLKLYAELDPQKPAILSAETDEAKVYVNKLPGKVFDRNVVAPDLPSTLLAEKKAGHVSVILSENMQPLY
jgi:hypothetical protein